MNMQSVDRTVVVLVPCHNEEETVVATIEAILAQDRPADRVIVVDDRSTDNTAALAKEAGVEVFSIVENFHMKGGALNQALAVVLPDLKATDVVLVVDADSIIGSNFISAALREFSKNPNLAGVSGSYLGKEGGGLLGWYQRNEFCQPEGTMVRKVIQRASGTLPAVSEEVPIETLQEGDYVVSHRIDGAWLQNSGRKITSFGSRQYHGDLITIETESGLKSKFTPEHWCPVWVNREALKDKYTCYLMRRGNDFRVGMAKAIRNQDTNHPALGFMHRFNVEKADDIWVIGVYDSAKEALRAEQMFQWNYMIPGLRFKGWPRKGTGGELTQEDLDSVWREIGDNRDRAEILIKDVELDINLPLARRGSTLNKTFRLSGYNYVNAINLANWMKVLPYRNIESGYSVKSNRESIVVEREFYSGLVYSMDVDQHHLYFADGILTHNCRWSYDDRKKKGKTVILSGAASAFTVESLLSVEARRLDGRLKGSGIYDTGSFTEDFELSLALLHSGFEIKKMLDVQVLTSYKPTWKSLYKQRLRWDRGITENLLMYGMTKHTRYVWIRRLIYAVQIPLSFICIALVTYRIGWGGGYVTNAFWIAIAGIMATEKFVTVWARGWQHAVAAGLLIPEIFYDMFLQTSFVRSVWDMAGHRDKVWR